MKANEIEEASAGECVINNIIDKLENLINHADKVNHYHNSFVINITLNVTDYRKTEEAV